MLFDINIPPLMKTLYNVKFRLALRGVIKYWAGKITMVGGSRYSTLRFAAPFKHNRGILFDINAPILCEKIKCKGVIKYWLGNRGKKNNVTTV